jgi:eukaryotic-like serine/threonine-protein kinase
VPEHCQIPTFDRVTVCSHCGAQVLIAALKCDQCGTALEASSAETVDKIFGSPTAYAPTVASLPASSAAPPPIHATEPSLHNPPDFGSRYRVEFILGEGGMGTVYKAWDTELERTVALKLIRHDLTRDPHVSQRFKQELLLASRISHRNVLRIHDLVDGPADIKFISMACIDGQDLHQLLKKEGKLPTNRALSIAHQLCSALEAAHAEGVIHRDLKPQNILIDQHDHIYVSDFGLAKSLEFDLSMTQTGQFLGTPKYMSPEQAEIRPVDHRSDLYAFGLILCEMVTGHLPFEPCASVMQMMYERVHGTAKDPRKLNPGVPEFLARIIQKCLEKDSALRYQSATEILADLDAGMAGVRHVGKKRSWTRTVRAFAQRQTVSRAAAVSAILIASAAIAAIFLMSGRPAKTVRQTPVSVLVGDFTNHTGDPLLDGTLEPMFNVALEGAGFVSAFDRNDARRLAKRLPNPSDKLDEQTSRLIAVSQGIHAVVTGSLSRRGDGYKISVEALDARTGNSIADSDMLVSRKSDILRNMPRLAAPIRKALGDETPESVQFGSVSGEFTASSLEGVHLVAQGMSQEFAGKFEDALDSFSKAAKLDPNFALAYSGMAGAALNLGSQKQAEKYLQLAMAHEDRMTDRERYRNRGLFYAITGNWPKCVDENTQLVQRYPAERVGLMNLAGCLAQQRDMPRALKAAHDVVEIAPGNALYRLQFSALSILNGDFKTGEQQARAALQINPKSEFGFLALGEAQLGQGQQTQAAESYRQLQKLGTLGSSLAGTALADLALYEGRFKETAQLLEEGASADLAARDPDSAAIKFAALGFTHLSVGESSSAVKAAAQALAHSQAVDVKFLAARIFAETGELAKAQNIAASLDGDLQSEPQAYGLIIRGKVALQRGEIKNAIQSLIKANTLLDTWIGRFELGRAYLQAGAFVEADSEFDRCISRRGEAIELFMNDVPTYGYFPSVYYDQGRVRDGLKSPESVNSYRTYFEIREKAGEDPRLPEIRRRVGM